MFEYHTKMYEVLETKPSLKQMLHQKFHMGGCQKCDFSLEGTVEEVARSKGIDPHLFLETLNDHENHTPEVLEIDSQSLKCMLDDPLQNCILLDVRQEWEYEIAHIPSSHLLQSLTNREEFLEFLKGCTQKIITICHHGVRSYQAAQFLQEQGIQRVYSLKGGIDAYAATIDSTIMRY
jgi:rhodanese-related sulfurtransferase